MNPKENKSSSLVKELLFDRAKVLGPEIASYSNLAEKQRHLSNEVIHAFQQSGIHRILQPKNYGGAGAHFSSMVHIVELISQACTAAGWCLTQYISHNCLIGYWPKEAQTDVWGNNPNAIVAGVVIPSCGIAQKCSEGWTLSGQWPFASGIDGADWFIAAAFAEEDSSERTPQLHLIPRENFTILDTWKTAGLRGTGSSDVKISECFVPQHRAIPISKTKGGGDAPGCKSNPEAIYRLPAFSMFSINQSAVALGLAQTTYNTYIKDARNRKTQSSGKTIADFSTAQVKIAEVKTAISIARMLLHECCNIGMQYAEQNAVTPIETKTELRAKAAMGGKLAAESVDLLFQLSGGAGLYDTNQISKAMRDMNCMRNHITQNWDVNASNYGRILLGLSSADPAI